MPFERSFTDPTRQCPVWAGPARLVGSRLTVQLPQGDAEIDAPPELLERVIAACDGSRSLSQIVDATRPLQWRTKVKSFLLDLMRAGVLTDASLYTVTAQRFAWVPSPFGNAAERSTWQQVPRRFSLLTGRKADSVGTEVATPIDAFVDRRLSVYTYDTRQLSEDSLRAYLWSIAGVVREEHERLGKQVARRTIPSGGAVHALRPYLILRTRVGQWSPGVYAVTYPAVRRVELKLLHDDVTLLPRAVSHPWYLSFATGMVFLVADPRLGAIKYRARALQYVFIEAGAALQNAALASPGLGIAMSIYGGYIETAVTSLLRLSTDDVILSSAVFGPSPAADQVSTDKASPHLEFEWADSASGRYTMPYFVGRCSVVARGEVLPETWGRALDPWTAYVKSAVESIERLGFRSPKNIKQGRIGDWDNVLDPRKVVRYSPAQYRETSFPFQPFNERVICGWTPGRSLTQGKSTMVLAEQVFGVGALRELFPRALARYTESNSSGCGAHLDEGRALNAALHELVERDAFLRSWLSQQPGIAITHTSMPRDLQRRVRSLEKMGCRVSVQRLPSEWAMVAVVYAQHETLHFSVVGAAARPELEAALQGALDELETLAYVRFHDQEVPPLKPSAIRTPTDHTLLYALAKYFRRVDPLMAPLKSASFVKLTKHQHGGKDLPHRLLAAGHQIITVDIAAPNSSIDQGRTPVAVIRAFVPGLIPMSFGYNREPLGMLETFDRRGRFPHPFP